MKTQQHFARQTGVEKRGIAMKSLLDIQQDVRALEKSVNEIKDAIKGISADIEELRNVNQTIEVDYKKLEVLAKQIPFERHPLNDKISDEAVCKIYLELLLMIARLDLEEKIYINRLVFIQWLQIQSGIERNLENLLEDCYQITEESYYELADLIPKEYRENFIVDALIVANIGGTANREIYQYIADLIMILGIDKERLAMLSRVVHMALCKRSGEMTITELHKFVEYARVFSYYVKDENVMKACRQMIVQLPDSSGARDFKWKVKQGQEVRKGDVVAAYNAGDWLQRREVRITSPSSGTIFQFRDNLTYYGVLSHKDDNKDDIKAWVKTGR